MCFSVASHPLLQRHSQTHCRFQHQRGNVPSLPRAGGQTHTHPQEKPCCSGPARGASAVSTPSPRVTGLCSNLAGRPGSSAPSREGWPGAPRGRDAGSGEPKQKQFCPKSTAELPCAMPTLGTEHRNNRNNPVLRLCIAPCTRHPSWGLWTDWPLLPRRHQSGGSCDPARAPAPLQPTLLLRPGRPALVSHSGFPIFRCTQKGPGRCQR